MIHGSAQAFRMVLVAPFHIAEMELLAALVSAFSPLIADAVLLTFVRLIVPMGIVGTRPNASTSRTT